MFVNRIEEKQETRTHWSTSQAPWLWQIKLLQLILQMQFISTF